MKHSFHPHHYLVIAAPICALTFSCLAQTTTTTVVVPSTKPAVAVQTDIFATGTVASFDASGLALSNVIGSTTVYLTNSNTVYVDSKGRFLSPDRIVPQTPATVFYAPVGNTLVATKVVVTDSLHATGTLMDVSPTGLAIQLPGAASTPVSYAYTNTTKYVDAKGKAVPLSTIPTGTPVRVTYLQSGDTFVASKVEVVKVSGPEAAQREINTQTTPTTVTREVKR